jgi:P-type conjugative transfer protein TrbG
MKWFIITIAFMPSIARAGNVPDIDRGLTPMAGSYVPAPSPMSSKEQKAASLAKEWIDAKVMPVRKEDGRIVYRYGATLPTVICAPLKLCDIELQKGEVISSTKPVVGDDRWSITPMISGYGADRVSHIIVKAQDTNIPTTLIITTDRRIYNINLRSSSSNWTPKIAFSYAEDSDLQWKQYSNEAEARAAKNTLPGTRTNIEDLNFNYEMSGKAQWKPLRVYNDGIKTFIQMPTAMSQTEAPALLVIGSDGEQQIVNYRLKGDRFVVDQIFNRAILLAGVGGSEESVTIEYKGSKK